MALSLSIEKLLRTPPVCGAIFGVTKLKILAIDKECLYRYASPRAAERAPRLRGERPSRELLRRRVRAARDAGGRRPARAQPRGDARRAVVPPRRERSHAAHAHR